MTLLEFFSQYPHFREYDAKVVLTPIGLDTRIEITFGGRYYVFSLLTMRNYGSSEFENLYRSISNIRDHNRAFKNLVFTMNGVWTCQQDKLPISPTKIIFDAANPNVGYDLGRVNEQAKKSLNAGMFYCYGCNCAKIQSEIKASIYEANLCSTCEVIDEDMKKLIETAKAA